ncbi:ApeA N-terminal domain 1-containing protein [Rhodocaloribacter sp.]
MLSEIPDTCVDKETGFWWIPDREMEPVPGSLSGTDSGFYLLELLQPILPVDFSTFPALRVVHGIGASGKLFTLYGCTLAGSRISYPGFETQSWMSGFVLTGRHVSDGDTFRIDRLDIQYSYLSAWLNRSALRLTRDRSQGTVMIQGASVPPLKYRITDDLEVWLVTESSTGSLRQPLKHVSLHEEDWFSLRFREPTFMNEAWGLVSSFQTLLTLLIGRPCQPVRARALAPKTGGIIESCGWHLSEEVPPE